MPRGDWRQQHAWGAHMRVSSRQTRAPSSACSRNKSSRLWSLRIRKCSRWRRSCRQRPMPKRRHMCAVHDVWRVTVSACKNASSFVTHRLCTKFRSTPSQLGACLGCALHCSLHCCSVRRHVNVRIPGCSGCQGLRCPVVVTDRLRQQDRDCVQPDLTLLVTDTSRGDARGSR